MRVSPSRFPRFFLDLDYPASEFSRWEEFPINSLKSRIAVADWNGDMEEWCNKAYYEIGRQFTRVGPPEQ
jgi:hypothetical protein